MIITSMLRAKATECIQVPKVKAMDEELKCKEKNSNRTAILYQFSRKKIRKKKKKNRDRKYFYNSSSVVLLHVFLSPFFSRDQKPEQNTKLSYLQSTRFAFECLCWFVVELSFLCVQFFFFILFRFRMSSVHRLFRLMLEHFSTYKQRVLTTQENKSKGSNNNILKSSENKAPEKCSLLSLSLSFSFSHYFILKNDFELKWNENDRRCVFARIHFVWSRCCCIHNSNKKQKKKQSDEEDEKLRYKRMWGQQKQGAKWCRMEVRSIKYEVSRSD